MSDTSGPAGSGGESPNAAQLEFQRYKARMGAMGAMPGPMVLPWAAPAWAMPPSFAPMLPPPGMGWPQAGQAGQAAGQAAGAVAGRLGETLRIGVDVLNAALASTAAALGGFAATAPGWGHGHYGHGHCGCGCGCSSCCGVMSCCCDPCCSPNVCGCC
jgi:hypothetical protein